MGLTISNWGNVHARPMASQDAVTPNDWNQLGRGLGGLARHGAMQKAADMMEGRKQAQARIAQIDSEIAGLEQQLATAQAKIDEANAQAMDENLWNSYLRENASPTEYTQPKAGMLGSDYVAAMNKADAMRQRAGMGGYETNPTDPNVLQAAIAAGQMLNYRPTYGGRVAQPEAGTLSPDYVAEENQAHQNAMAALNAQRKYRWGR